MLGNSGSLSVDNVLAIHKRRRHFSLTPLDSDADTHVIAQFREIFRNARQASLARPIKVTHHLQSQATHADSMPDQAILGFKTAFTC